MLPRASRASTCKSDNATVLTPALHTSHSRMGNGWVSTASDRLLPSFAFVPRVHIPYTHVSPLPRCARTYCTTVYYFYAILKK